LTFTPQILALFDKVIVLVVFLLQGGRPGPIPRCMKTASKRADVVESMRARATAAAAVGQYVFPAELREIARRIESPDPRGAFCACGSLLDGDYVMADGRKACGTCWEEAQIAAP
jgi:hypothetical protein